MVQPGQRDAYRSATSDVTGLESARIVSTYNDSIDVLVNNAVVLSPSDGVLEWVDFGQVIQSIDVNACGPLRVNNSFCLCSKTDK